MKESIMRLFKGYVGEKVDSVNEEGLKYGLLIPGSASEEVVELAIKMYGKDGEKWNETLHKSFIVVRDSSIEELVREQLLHYFTTYGFEELGIYSDDSVYIPHEKLEIPELKGDIELINIHALSYDEVREKVMVLLTSGIALSDRTVKDIIELIGYNFVDVSRVDEVVNREIKIALYDKYGIVPKNNEEFLRYLIFKTTGETLKIKNKYLISKIEECDKKYALILLLEYVNGSENGYTKLSEIFLRNKELFLAYKIHDDEWGKETHESMNYVINRLRKLAKKTHKGLKRSILDSLTDDSIIDYDELYKKLDDVTIFREIRMLNGVLYRLQGNNDIVYKIRNGASWVKKTKDKELSYYDKLENVRDTIKKHLASRLKDKLNGKVVYIPDNITYSAPTSEKQFNGNIPEGSYLEIPRDGSLIYGIHWKDVGRRTDLDLKQMNKSEVFGWDGAYRSNSIYFSGDVTSAPEPKGATELFYVGRNYGHGAFLVTVNDFTTHNCDVPFEFVIAKGKDDVHIPNDYVIDPNDILEKIDMIVPKDGHQLVAGFIVIGDNIKFYFNDFSAGSGITSRQNDVTMGAFSYLQTYSKTQVKLNDLLVDCGVTISNKPTRMVHLVTKVGDEIVKEEDVEVPVDIDLSPNNITKESIISLLS